MKIIFMGTPSYATKIFAKLVEDKEIEVVALITQPDKPVGRKQILTPPDIKKFAINSNINIDILQPNSLRDGKIQSKIKSYNADFIVVSAYGKILPKEVLNIATCINLHASLLPKYRGASPIQEAILNQDKFTGVTAMKMDIGLDTGDILGFNYIEIGDMKVNELFEKLSILASNLTIKILKNYNQIKAIPQIDMLSSHCSKIKKSDGMIELNNNQEVFVKFKAFYFWPGINLNNGLKIKEMKLSDKQGIKNQIIEIKKQSIIVACQKGSIEIMEVQPPNRKQMNVIDFICGRRLNLGDFLV